MPQNIDVTGLPDSVVLDIQQLVASIRANLGPRIANGQPLNPAEKLRLFDAWVKSHPPCPVIADDGRESIYAGRGE